MLPLSQTSTKMTLKKFSRNDARHNQDRDDSVARHEQRHEKHMRNAFRAGFHPELLGDDELDELGFDLNTDEYDW